MDTVGDLLAIRDPGLALEQVLDSDLCQLDRGDLCQINGLELHFLDRIVHRRKHDHGRRIRLDELLVLRIDHNRLSGNLKTHLGDDITGEVCTCRKGVAADRNRIVRAVEPLVLLLSVVGELYLIREERILSQPDRIRIVIHIRRIDRYLALLQVVVDDRKLQRHPVAVDLKDIVRGREGILDLLALIVERHLIRIAGIGILHMNPAGSVIFLADLLIIPAVDKGQRRQMKLEGLSVDLNTGPDILKSLVHLLSVHGKRNRQRERGTLGKFDGIVAILIIVRDFRRGPVQLIGDALLLLFLLL